jgi:hypothetical protein
MMTASYRSATRPPAEIHLTLLLVKNNRQNFCQ